MSAFALNTIRRIIMTTNQYWFHHAVQTGDVETLTRFIGRALVSIESSSEDEIIESAFALIDAIIDEAKAGDPTAIEITKHFNTGND
jgi:hypothetical protein